MTDIGDFAKAIWTDHSWASGLADPARECDARDIFGFAPTQLKQRIKEGAIPRPVLLAPPPSRAKGWYGYMINEHRARVEAQQEAWAAEKKNFYVPTPPQQRKKPEPMKPKVKKVKLILPRKAKG